MNTNKRETEHTANLALATAPVLPNNNGWKVGKNFLKTPPKRVIINAVKQKGK